MTIYTVVDKTNGNVLSLHRTLIVARARCSELLKSFPELSLSVEARIVE